MEDTIETVPYTYDAIGNPLNDGTWSCTWEAGRQLKQMSKAGMTVQFKYDHNGLRTQKKVVEGDRAAVYDYTLQGRLVTHMTASVNGIETDYVQFVYDIQSRPIKVEFNGEMYTYLHNLQGGIVDASGNLVVEYKYNAWGKLL